MGHTSIFYRLCIKSISPFSFEEVVNCIFLVTRIYLFPSFCKGKFTILIVGAHAFTSLDRDFLQNFFLSTRSHAFLNSLGMNTDIRGTTNLIKWKDDQVEAEHVIVVYCIGLSYFHAMKLKNKEVYLYKLILLKIIFFTIFSSKVCCYFKRTYSYKLSLLYFRNFVLQCIEFFFYTFIQNLLFKKHSYFRQKDLFYF